MHPKRTPRRAEDTAARSRAPAVGLVWIWAVFGLCAVGPAAGVAAGALRGSTGRAELVAALAVVRGETLALSAAYAAAIALLALALAWPAAVLVSRARRRVWLLLAAAPMLLPPYLAYAGWSIIRAPTTPLGRWIGEAPDRGLEWLPIAAGRTLAVWGLALWAWPLAAIVIALSLRSIGPDVIDSLRLERCTRARRSLVLARAAWPGIAAAMLLVWLLMLGSAVPLHVARVETHAIRVWMVLDEHPAEPWLAWVAAWPLVVLALAAGWLLSAPLARVAVRFGALTDGDRPNASPPLPGLIAAALPSWLLAIAAPLALFLWSAGSANALVGFVRLAGHGIASSAATGAAVGAIALTLALGASHAVAARSSASLALRPLLALAIAWALLPGVLVGASVAQFVRLPMAPSILADSAAPMVIAHVARFAFLPLAVGVWLGSTESAPIAELRRVDGAVTLGAWLRTALPAQLAPAAAAAVAAGFLSFHEVEAAIQVQPPGIQYLPQRLLQWLHYERTTELSAAGAFLLGSGLIVCGVVVLVARRR